MSKDQILKEFDEKFTRGLVMRTEVKSFLSQALEEQEKEENDKKINGFKIKNGQYEWIIYQNIEFIPVEAHKNALLDELKLAFGKESLNMYHNGGVITKLEWLEHRIAQLKKESEG